MISYYYAYLRPTITCMNFKIDGYIPFLGAAGGEQWLVMGLASELLCVPGVKPSMKNPFKIETFIFCSDMLSISCCKMPFTIRLR